MRLLGVDLGMKRIGLAIAETDPFVATPRPAIPAVGRLISDAQRVAEFARREQVDAVIVGLPIEESGAEGRMARVCRTFAGHLSAAGLVTHLVDEAFTSIEAENAMLTTDLTAAARRKRRDGEAAARILERYVQNAP
jgi:putative Holliday junction resolvase